MYSIGVDLGGTNIAAGLVNEKMEIVARGSVPTLPDRGNAAVMQDMAELCLKLIADAELTPTDIAWVGIASPGSILHAEGMVERSDNLHFLRFPIVAELRARLPIEKIYLENDANAATLAEALAGVAKGTRNSMMITLGTGLGGGVIVDGKMVYGMNGAAGELGHIVIERGGRLCNCGRRGCWEAYSSATALVRMTEEKIAECERLNRPTKMTAFAEKYGRVNARVAFDAMKAGDCYGREVVEQYQDYLACGITNMINIFQPEVLSVGGGVCNERENLLSPALLHRIEEEQFTRDAVKKTAVRIAALGNDAGIIGAAGLGYSL